MMRTILRSAAIAAFILTIQPVAHAATSDVRDLTPTFHNAGAAVDRLQVYEIAGIVIIRGRTNDPAQAAQLATYAQSLGYTRVANLVEISTDDDVTIERLAERELSIHRALDGCQFHVASSHGVVTVGGHVRHELQKDVARQVLRGIDGVRAIEVNLDRF
jgi:osmotically-inducible protein OsmY